jgi:sec-independent protein translocase protein TatC
MAQAVDDKRMPFLEHLRELRTRIIISLVAVTIGFIIAWAFHEAIFDWLMQPYEQAVASQPSPFHETLLSQVPGSGAAVVPQHLPVLRYKGLLEPFMVYLTAALLGGVFLAIPVIFWQLWAFIAPGLYAHERRLAAPFIIGTTFFFLIGAGFCRYVVLEPACAVLMSIGARNTEPMLMMQDYFGLTSRFLVVFGLVFEMPILVMFLALMGIVTHKTLLKWWRFAVVGAFIVGALLTPPDPFSQIMLAVPLLALYAISIGVAYFFAKRGRVRRRSGEAAEAGG